MMNNNELDKTHVIPIYHQLYSTLLDRIEDGVYKAHDRLPSENELCAAYHISRSTAQKALQILVDQGVAYRTQGKGTYVADKMLTYSITASLSYSAEIIGLHKNPLSRFISAKEMKAPARVARKLGLRKNHDVYSIQRVRLVDNTPMSLQTSYLPVELVPGLIDYEFSEGSLFKTIKKNYGHQIGQGTETLKAVRCDAYEAKMLRIKEGDPVFLLERCTQLENGQAIEFVRTILRGDKSKFFIRLDLKDSKGKHLD
jgi:GntR family transcriptional regulator